MTLLRRALFNYVTYYLDKTSKKHNLPQKVKIVLFVCALHGRKLGGESPLQAWQ